MQMVCQLFKIGHKFELFTDTPLFYIIILFSNSV